jgi:hypothetical protein
MKLRSKPRKPTKNTFTLTYSVYGATLQQIIDYFRSILEHNYTEEEIQEYLTLENISIDSVWNYDEYCSEAVLKIPPSAREYNKALDKYEKKLTAYNKWYNENKDAIEAEKMRRIVFYFLR